MMNPNNPMTPGVYTRELNAFPNSVPMVPTAIPVFIGYTLKASFKGNDLTGKPQYISTFREFSDSFGGVMPMVFQLKAADPKSTAGSQVSIAGKPFSVSIPLRYRLADALRLYFANGGGPCYIISVGQPKGDGTDKIDKGTLWPEGESPITEVLKNIPFPKPTIIVIPDACGLDDATRFSLYNQVLAHCIEQQDRVVLMDVPTSTSKPKDDADAFRNEISGMKLSYGIAYYPELKTNIHSTDDLSLVDLDSTDALDPIKGTWQATGLKFIKEFLAPNSYYDDASLKDKIAKNPIPADQEGPLKTALKPLSDASKSPDNLDRFRQTLVGLKNVLHSSLLADPVAGVTYKNLLVAMAAEANIMPPSPAMAGAYALIDGSYGVWRAPANLNLQLVQGPTIALNDDTQAALNVDANGGKSINAIRSFFGRGPAIVWGARTLDGNSKDWRYINVRRTIILIEQSVANAAFAFVFEPNTSGTWSTCQSMISGFLRNLWTAGALQGSSPQDAYSVSVGLGTTMTGDDILDGIMRIEVKIALVRPAEFIIITYQQQMAKS